MTSFDLILKGGRVVTPAAEQVTDVAIRDGRIAALGDLARAGKAAEVVDVSGLTVLPGVIDSQVHLREPGNEHKEDLETGSRAAVKGGVVAVFEMPNTNPPTTTAEAIADKLVRARGRMFCDHAFFVGAAMRNVHRLAELERLPGCAGVKVFMGSSTGNLLVDDDATVTHALASGRRRVAVHCEHEPRLQERWHLVKDGAEVHAHPEWRDVDTALEATRRLLSIVEGTGRRVHVLHVTTAEEMALLADHKALASVEVTPQHLTLAAPECYDRLGSKAQMNPPIREARHREALWQALDQGVVDVIGSDHAPHTLEEKARPYPQSPSGMPGVQTLVPVMLSHVNAGRLSLRRFVDLTSAGPARVYNVAGKGRLAVGYDADLTVVDMTTEREITDNWIESRAGWTPFAGFKATAWPIHTVVRGRMVVRDETIMGDAQGRPVRFLDCYQ
ncbi:dihydroorotase [Roseospirillum parvum]|uniref:Dihydroorotase n=1 Tax=Roseospirillum parvum TaxID=83401 RepID=A0A1G7U381_9PROT|nr:dihydroorotase [Roseospirillum parvum]SDG41519.1 dihydroorotase [Roseospirillum parvum]